MRMNLFSMLALSLTLFTPACDDGDGDSGGDDDGGGDEAGDEAGDGECAGPVTECPLADLSESQQATYCDTVLAVVDDEPGTVYKCESDGYTLTLNTRDECIANMVLPDCPITVGDVIDCYKAAKSDACAAFAEDGACAPVFTGIEICF